MSEETNTVVDRGDDFVPTSAEKVEVELSGEDLAKIGRAPENTEAAESQEKKEAEDTKDPEAKDDEGKKEEKAPEKKPIMIPKARFDELNKRAKDKVAALERENKQLKDRLGSVDGDKDAEALEQELDAKSDEYGKLVADGELDKAKEVMREINRINRRIGLAEATRLSNAHAEESRHVNSLESLVGMYKETFPVFDDAHADYNQGYVDFVARLQGGFEAAGVSPAEALREAVEVAVVKFSLLGHDEEVKPEEKKPDKGVERKTEAVNKAVKAAGAQPPKLDKAGADSDKAGMGKLDLAGLSMDEFMKLPESTVKRLRGDII